MDLHFTDISTANIPIETKQKNTSISQIIRNGKYTDEEILENSKRLMVFF